MIENIGLKIIIYFNDCKILEFVAECAMCQALVTNIEKLLVDPKADENIEEVMKKVCKYLPQMEQNKVSLHHCNLMLKYI